MISLKLCNIRHLFYILYKSVWCVLRLSISVCHFHHVHVLIITLLWFFLMFLYFISNNCYYCICFVFVRYLLQTGNCQVSILLK